MSSAKLSVGVVGGGLGGLTAAIACARAGVDVTILEAAPVLGEIGAGIQMFGNVSKFLTRCGIDEIADDDLVSLNEFRIWGGDGDGKLLGLVDMKRVESMQGFPWWVIRRDHLHAALNESAKRHGVKVIVDFRVTELDCSNPKPKVTSAKGTAQEFDLVIGADGIKSFMRTALFPDLMPRATSNIAAYRDVISYQELFAHIPEARTKISNTMDVWIGPGGYILLYPLSGGKELNVVCAFEQWRPVTQIEELNIQEFRDHYKGWDPFLVKVLELVKETRRWPLLTVPPVKTWSNKQKNVVLMGDAIHGMQNHMAQGAACAMEDGVFLGRVLSDVVRGSINLSEALVLYEQKRKPRAWLRQQASFVSGELSCERGEVKTYRERSTLPEIQRFDRNPLHLEALPPTYRSWLLFSSPFTIPGILYSDAEEDADFAVCEYLQNKGDADPQTLVSRGLRARFRSAIYDNGTNGSNLSTDTTSFHRATLVPGKVVKVQVGH